MKYVIVAVKDEDGNMTEYPVIFPNALNHIDMAAVLTVMLTGDDESIQVGPTAAGFVNSLDIKVAPHGKSETLNNLEPLPGDGDFIRVYDYVHGDRGLVPFVGGVIGSAKH